MGDGDDKRNSLTASLIPTPIPTTKKTFYIGNTSKTLTKSEFVELGGMTGKSEPDCITITMSLL